MRLLKNVSFRAGVIYFLILLSIAFLVRDIPNQPDAFTVTLQQLTKPGSMGDPSSFATVAIDIAENGWISSTNEWAFNAWPPGFILLESMIIKVLGYETPVLLVLQVLAATLFSILLTLLFNFLREIINSKLAFVLPLLIFSFPVSRVFLLQPIGISLGESFSIGFFLISIFLAIHSVVRNSFRVAVYAGLCLALSAYFRPQFEIILLALSGWWILTVITIKWMRLQDTIELKTIKSAVKKVAIILLIAHAATFPWRGYHWINQGSPLWVYSPGGTMANSVKTSEELEKVHGGFVVAGGGNLVCRIDPKTCGDTVNAKKLFVKTFVGNPVEWYSLKFDVIGKYWFSSVKNWVVVSEESTSMDIVINGLLLIVLVAIICLLFSRKVRNHRAWFILIWFNASLYSSYFLIFTVTQFEVRYFYFPKIAGLVMIIIVASLFFCTRKNDDDNSQSKKTIP